MMNVSENFINVNMQFIIGKNGEFRDFSEIYGRETTGRIFQAVYLGRSNLWAGQTKQTIFKCRYACMDPVISILLFNI